MLAYNTESYYTKKNLTKTGVMCVYISMESFSFAYDTYESTPHFHRFFLYNLYKRRYDEDSHINISHTFQREGGSREKRHLPTIPIGLNTSSNIEYISV